VDKLCVVVNVIYTCPICGQNGFTSQANAEACRDSHLEPAFFDGVKFGLGEVYPDEITVKFSNSVTGLYELKAAEKV
jgi:hypothetical protein